MTGLPETGDRNRGQEKREIRSSFKVGAAINGLFPLTSGEVAAVGIEPKAIVIFLGKLRCRDALRANFGGARFARPTLLPAELRPQRAS